MQKGVNDAKKLALIPLILMIFTSVFGFTNIPRSFYLMGYGAIPWYLLSGITFFIPYAFMMAEYGSAFKEEKGGLGLLGVIWVITVTYIASHGLKSISKVTSVGGTAVIATVIVTATVAFANFFTIIQPAIEGDLSSTIWMIVGPVFFSLVALLMYNRYEHVKEKSPVKVSTKIKPEHK